MSIIVGQLGVPFRLTTGGFDMSTGPGYELNFTKPDGTTLQKDENSSNPVSAPAVALTNDPDVGNQAASTYFEFITVLADFDQAGTWSVCGIYSEASKTLPTTADVEFEVLEACT